MDIEMKELIRENERLKAAFTVLLAKYEAAAGRDHACVIDKEDAETLMRIVGHKPKQLEVITFEPVEVDA